LYGAKYASKEKAGHTITKFVKAIPIEDKLSV